jgi:hypothetical protein
VRPDDPIDLIYRGRRPWRSATFFNSITSLKAKKDLINQRRRKTGRPDIELEPEAFADTPLAMSDGTTPLRPN